MLEEALLLSESDRGMMAAKLLESLDGTGSSDRDLDESWDEEIRMRLEEIESGREVPIPWEQARAMIFRDEADAD